LNWDRHEKNIYGKITHWFEVIGKILQDPAILAENVYNMDETGVMLSMPGSVKGHRENLRMIWHPYLCIER
jgi:hypothetical protein